MKNYKSYIIAILCSIAFTSCDSSENVSNKDHDGHLFGEWVEYNDGKNYVHDYYRFYSDGDGIHGSYESDIDWINEDEDIKWYTVNDKYLYIDGNKYEYWCDGTSLTIQIRGKSRTYREL
ncbi:MAG: hypothetical protein IKA26_05930 [Alistipes sp.]|nr:hypothetical protein [Alistipes sp.]